MMSFVILARRRFEGASVPLVQVRTENRAIEIAHRIHKQYSMNRTMVIDEKIKVVFKLSRRCKCANAQYNLEGKLICESCSSEISTLPIVEEAKQ